MLNLEEEKLRVKSLFDFDNYCLLEKNLSSSGYVLGIDEVGRGPLAGPLCVGGVIYKSPVFIKWLNDSKEVSEKRRPFVAQEIKSYAIFCKTCFIDAKKIDEIGISECLKLAFEKIIELADKTKFPLSLIVIDGNCCLIKDKRIKTVVKGDAKSASIASASVIAKVKRDDFMIKISSEYPQFCFDKNKGYGTMDHRSALSEFGACPHHRLSYLKNIIR